MAITIICALLLFLFINPYPHHTPWGGLRSPSREEKQMNTTVSVVLMVGQRCGKLRQIGENVDVKLI